MLYQAFLNILINAMQAMPEGGKIWDPFFTTKAKGTGLGLGIVKNIIESHSGSVQISAKPGAGARVKVELPVKQGV